MNGGGWTRPASDLDIDGSSVDGTTLPDLGRFNDGTDVVAISEADALGYACNSLCVNGIGTGSFAMVGRKLQGRL